MAPNSSDAGSDVDPAVFASEGGHDETERSRMGFLEHLDELRRRLIYSVYAIAGCSVVAFWFIGDLNRYMLAYFAGLAGRLLATQITEGFIFEFKVGLLAAFILASPFVFAQLWFFVAPGLYAREKKVVFPFVLSVTTLFACGVVFAHLIAFPAMIKFFVGNFSNSYLEIRPSIQLVFSFYLKMVLGFGLVFEMPVLVFFLARFGIVSAGFLWGKTRYAILIIFIIAAIVTPTPDPINQTIFALPMIGLYFISIGVAWAFGKKRPDAA